MNFIGQLLDIASDVRSVSVIVFIDYLDWFRFLVDVVTFLFLGLSTSLKYSLMVNHSQLKLAKNSTSCFIVGWTMVGTTWLSRLNNVQLLNEQCCSLLFQQCCSALMKQQRLFTVVETGESNWLIEQACSLLLLNVATAVLMVEQCCKSTSTRYSIYIQLYPRNVAVPNVQIIIFTNSHFGWRFI